jgi:LysM repeat protein
MATLAGLAVVPVALVQLGMPNVSEVRSAVSLRWMPPELGGHLVALVGWIIWVYVVVWLVVALVTEVRGASLRLPRLLRPALVPVVSVVMSLFVRSPAAPQPGMVTAATVTAAPVSPSPTVSPATLPQASPTEWMVEEGQSLWSIAETVYGDGEQCLRIAAANPGLDPRDLQVGQVLRLPGGENSVQRAPQQWRVQEGESLWSIAETVYGDGKQWARIADANRGREVAPGQVFSDPSLIEPGWMLDIPAPVQLDPPAPPEPAPTPPPPVAPTPSRIEPQGGDGPTSSSQPREKGPAFGNGHVDNAAQRDASGSSVGAASGTPSANSTIGNGSRPHNGSSQSHEATGDGLAEVAVSVGLAAVAAGLTATLRLRRRVQQRRRRVGRRITLPPQSLADLEAALSATRRAEPDLLDAGLRLLTAKLRDTDLTAPTILAVRRGRAHLELFLGEPADLAPPPFVAVGGGATWRLDLHAAGDAGLAGVDEIAPCPTLVTAGADAEGPVLVHLEASRFLACGGDGAQAVGGLASMAVELATSAWQGGFELALVDFPARLDGLEGVRRASLDDALTEAEAQARANANHLVQGGWASPSAAALAGEIDPSEPFVVVCGRNLTEAEADRVSQLTESTRGTVVVVALGRPAAAPWQLAYEGEQVSVTPLGLTLRSSRLEADELEGLDGLLTTATDEDCAPDSAPYADHAPIGSDGPSAEVEVNLLGPVEVVGAAEPIDRPIGKELVAFLATRERGVTTEIWTTALRPEARLSPNYIGHAATAVRKGLGRALDGEWHLPPIHRHGQLRLRDTVGSDWARFRRLAKSSEPADWEQALSLVRGQPFADSEWDWPIREGLVAEMQAEVVDLAVLAGEAALERTEPQRAVIAAEAGITACPWDERLYRLLMRAHAAQVNLSAVRAVMRRLSQVLEAEVEPFDAVESETRQLFAQLTGAHRMAAEG